MDIEYKRDLNQNYLVINEENMVSPEDYQIRMFTANDIKGLLKCNLRMIDGKARYHYEITSKQPMSRIFEKTLIEKKDLIMIMIQIREILEQLKEYLLSAECLILNQDYIYMNIEKGELYFCYLPGYKNDISLAFHQLAEFMLSRIDHNDKEGVVLGYELYQQTLEDNYGLDHIIEKIIGEKETIQEEYEEPELENPTDEKEEKEEKEEKKEGINYRIIIIAISGIIVLGIAAVLCLKINFIRKESLIKWGGVLLLVLPLIIYYYIKKNKDYILGKQEDIIIEQEEPLDNLPEEINRQRVEEVLKGYPDGAEIKEVYGDTMLLGHKMKGKDRFLECVNKYEGENIIISGYPFLLGKLESVVDEVIRNDTVSRIHAKILNKGDNYYISDLNSTNGTYLNEVCLEADEIAEMKIGDKIRMGEVEYYFK